MARFDDPRRVLVWGLVAIALFVGAGLGVKLVRGTSGLLGLLGRSAPAVVTHETVMERLRDVAKLVASEMTLRDVVIYEQTRFRSTKRAMLVVTGRVSAGINLRSAAVEIDSGARRIVVTLPPAQITAVEVLNVTTYDERSGLLNPFTPDDRDAIQQRIRAQLNSAARQSGILEHADQSAAKTLEELLKVQGYVVEIRRPLELERPTG
ncbi:MAG: DUF4230 domain-containing protein [Gemmatimonadaceae bacterium]